MRALILILFLAVSSQGCGACHAFRAYKREQYQSYVMQMERLNLEREKSKLGTRAISRCHFNNLKQEKQLQWQQPEKHPRTWHPRSKRMFRRCKVVNSPKYLNAQELITNCIYADEFLLVQITNLNLISRRTNWQEKIRLTLNISMT